METGSRAGVLYVIDSEAKTINWGVLPLADKTIAVIDGLQGANPEEFPQLREALREGLVTVKRKVSGEAHCRARIIASANPERDMASYTHRVEALLNIRSIPNP